MPPWMSRGLVLVSSGLLLIVIAGCGARFRATGPQAPAPSEGARALVEWLRNHVGATSSAKVLMRISVRSPEGSMSFDGILFSERPSSLRLQGFNPFGQRLFDLVTRGEIVVLRIDSEQRYFEGTIDELGAGLKLPALPQILELMASVTFVPPDPSQDVVMDRLGSDPPVRLSFYVGSGDHRQLTRRIWIDRDGLPVREEWYDTEQRMTANVTFDNYRVSDQRWQPKNISAVLQGDVTVKVTIKELLLDPVWTPEDFHIQRVRGASARR